VSDAVLLITLGGPRAREEVKPFIEGILRGKPVPPGRIEEVARHYESIGGASPLNAITARQAEALQAALSAPKGGSPSDKRLSVYVGMRAWRPTLADTLARMADDGVRRAVALVFAVFRSDVGLRKYQEAVADALAALGPRAPRVDYVDPWFDHPLFVDAVAGRVGEALAGLPADLRAGAAWIFTAHSIPAASGGADIYQSDFRRAVELVCAKFGRREWALAYQSRSGDPRTPWLEPDVASAIRSEAAKGAKAVLVVPLGFVADHVEVLYDLDIEARRLAEGLGLRFARAQTVGEHPAFINMLAQVVRQRLIRS